MSVSSRCGMSCSNEGFTLTSFDSILASTATILCHHQALERRYIWIDIPGQLRNSGNARVVLGGAGVGEEI
jgi:hypothetical protein